MGETIYGVRDRQKPPLSSLFQTRLRELYNFLGGPAIDEAREKNMGPLEGLLHWNQDRKEAFLDRLSLEGVQEAAQTWERNKERPAGEARLQPDVKDEDVIQHAVFSNKRITDPNLQSQVRTMLRRYPREMVWQKHGIDEAPGGILLEEFPTPNLRRRPGMPIPMEGSRIDVYLPNAFEAPVLGTNTSLFDEFPYLRDWKVVAYAAEPGDHAYTNLKDKIIGISMDDIHAGQAEQQLIHEMEHVIAHHEGRPSGSSPALEVKRLVKQEPWGQRFIDLGVKAQAQGPAALTQAEQIEFLDGVNKMQGLQTQAHQNYRNNPGEVIARVSEDRFRFFDDPADYWDFPPFSSTGLIAADYFPPGSSGGPISSADIEVLRNQTKPKKPKLDFEPLRDVAYSKPFWSNPARTLLERPQMLGNTQKMPASQLLGVIRKLPGQKELRWMGLHEMLARKGSEKVAVQPIINYLAEGNLVKMLEMRQKGSLTRHAAVGGALDEDNIDDELNSALGSFQDQLEEAGLVMADDAWEELFDHMRVEVSPTTGAGEYRTQYRSPYNTPPPYSYREHFLALPHENMETEILRAGIDKKIADAMERRLISAHDLAYESPEGKELTDWKAQIDETEDYIRQGPGYMRAWDELWETRESYWKEREHLSEMARDKAAEIREQAKDEYDILKGIKGDLPSEPYPQVRDTFHFPDVEGQFAWSREDLAAIMPPGADPERQAMASHRSEYPLERGVILQEVQSKHLEYINEWKKDKGRYTFAVPDRPPVTPFDSNMLLKKAQASLYEAAEMGMNFIAFPTPEQLEQRYSGMGEAKWPKANYGVDNPKSIPRQLAREIEKVTGEKVQITQENLGIQSAARSEGQQYIYQPNQGPSTVIRLTPKMREKILKRGFKISKIDLARQVLYG